MSIFCRIVLALIPLCAFSSTAYGEEIDLSDLYESDPYFEPGVTETNNDRIIKEEVGFVMPPMNLDLPPVRNRVIYDPGRDNSSPEPQEKPKTQQQSTSTQSNNQAGESTTQDGSGGGNNTNASSTNNGGSGGGAGAGGSGIGSNGNSVPEIEAGSGNVANVKAGLLYADDDSSADYEAEEAVPGKQASAMNRRPAAVALNNRNSSGARGDDDGGSNPSAPGRPGGSGVGGANMGTFQSGGGQQPNAKPGGDKPGGDGYFKKLSNIASNMGEKFFGLGSGSGGSSGNRSRSGGSGFNNLKMGKNGIKTASAKGVDPNMRDLLKKGLNQYTRGVASRLELGGKKGQVFGGMCSHYAQYARRHRIPNDRVDCSEY